MGRNGNGSSAASPPRTSVTLVVPTRNEAAHVEAFIQRVTAALAPFAIDWHAEVIDNSEDGTASILRELLNRGVPLEVTQQEDADGGTLGHAIRTGLSHASGDIVCVIDADLQHPPEVLPELLAPIVLGRADVCVGSRYRPGGSAAGLESPWRRLVARAWGVASRVLLPATRLTSDPGSGLFALRTEVLDGIALRPRGSRVLAEILVRARWRTTCDVPYRFARTDGGPAELGPGDGFALARELASLWRFRPWLAALKHDRRGVRRDPLRGRRRVALVHVGLLPAATEGDRAPAPELAGPVA